MKLNKFSQDYNALKEAQIWYNLSVTQAREVYFTHRCRASMGALTEGNYQRIF